MKLIRIEVPDMLAEKFEAASERDKLVWAYRLASFVEGDTVQELKATFKGIEDWQVSNGVKEDEFDDLLVELTEED